MLVISVYPRTILQPSARAWERISIRNSVHQKSRVSGSSGFGTLSNSLTLLAHTVEPSWSIKPAGYLHKVKNGYSSMSKFSKFNGVLRFGVPANRKIPAVVFGSTFNEHPKNSFNTIIYLRLKQSMSNSQMNLVFEKRSHLKKIHSNIKP